MSRRLLILVLILCILITGCKSGPFGTGGSSPFPWRKYTVEDRCKDAALGTAVLIGAAVLIVAVIGGLLYLDSLDGKIDLLNHLLNDDSDADEADSDDD